MTSYEYIQYHVADRVAWITFHRDEKLNAMNLRMMLEIIQALEAVDRADPVDVAVCVLTGQGRAFMAGADIAEYAQATLETFREFQINGRLIYSGIERNSKPVIAAINGPAFGGGFEIALACDMLVACKGVVMGLPEIKLNLIPGGGGTQRLVKKIGLNLANELLMTGRSATAEELQKAGLINHVFEKDSFISEVTSFAQSIAIMAPDRLQAVKLLTQLSAGSISSAAQDMEIVHLLRFYQSSEGQKSIQEFYERSKKRKNG